MRIGYNGSFWNKPFTGSGQYLQELAGALERCEPENEYRIVLPGQGSAPMSPAATASTTLKVAAPALNGLGENVAKTWFEQITFPRWCKANHVALAHVPYFASPLFTTVRTVVTIHDLIPLILPLYRGSALVRLYTHLVSASARRAHAVIADSTSSKRDIVKRLGIPAERVHVIYLAANERFRPDQETGAVRRKYNLPDRFILYLGGYDQRKNVCILIKAFSLLPDLYQAGYRLVMAGALPPHESSLFPDPRRMVRESGLAENAVLFAGEITEADKPAVYSSAAVFAFPSFYEGFGLPALEAMACGTPVVCSDSSSLPEVVGEAGLAIDPKSPEQWADSLRIVVSDRARAESMRACGLRQASEFSWARTARETLRVYKRVIED